jgi:hypothetical protein
MVNHSQICVAKTNPSILLAVWPKSSEDTFFVTGSYLESVLSGGETRKLRLRIGEPVMSRTKLKLFEELRDGRYYFAA